MTDWIQIARDALASEHDRQEVIAKAIYMAHQEMGLTQRSIALALGRNPSWVCRMLQWYMNGCQNTAFGPEIAARRKVATSQSGPLSAEQEGQLALLLQGGSSIYVPGQRDATYKVVDTATLCSQLSQALDRLSQDDLDLVVPAEPAMRQKILRRYHRALLKLSTSVDTALHAASIAAGATRLSADEASNDESGALPANENKKDKGSPEIAA